MTATNSGVRRHVVDLLKGGSAHVTFDAAVKGLPPELQGKRPRGSEHSPWQLLEHLRITQWDILEFSRNPGHQSPDWPSGYWPAEISPADDKAWEKSVRTFRSDLKALCEMIADESTDLFAPIPHGEGQTVLREALLAADHNAYHIGQLVLTRCLLGAWKQE